MSRSIFLGALLSFIVTIGWAQADSTKITQEQYQAIVDSIHNQLNYEHGVIKLNKDVATLNVPDGYKFLNSKQSEYVLTDLWGNPPSKVIGLLFPENTNPLSDNFTYAVEVTYSEDGYIDDEDAADIDYSDLLKQMKEDAISTNEERQKQGYDPIELVGWASSPFYDSSSKKLHWAKELKFGKAEMNTLNYNIRVLGRKGYLNLNVIGDMTTLPLVKKDINNILASVEFNKGYRYEEYDSSIDKAAAYGIGGLIAGKVLAKSGIFVMLAKFWKLIAVGFVGALAAFKKKLFGKKEEE